MDSAIHDPLAINLQRQIRVLLQKIPQNSCYAVQLSNATSFRESLVVLSRLLARSELTELVAITFRPILTDLCARWVEADDCSEEHLCATAFLVESQEELYPILDRILRKENFRDGPLSFIKEEIVDVETSRLHSLLLAYFRILQANREIPEMFLWPLMPLSTIIWSGNTDNAAKLLAIRCYAMQSCMGEAERENFEKQVFGEPFGPDCLLEYGLSLNGEKRLVDGWLLPVIERERILKWRNNVPEAVSQEGYYIWEHGEDVEKIDETDLSPSVTNINGVLLLRSTLPTATAGPSRLILTPTINTALRNLATHISLRLPTLLTSPPSAGKSLLLTHLASLLHPRTPNQIITIHLADTSLDARALLGSYISSSTSPGIFEWKEGILVRGMRGGHWIVFEDVDKASSEVLGTIRPLIESMRLGRWIGQRAEIYVPGRGKVIAEDTFRVFATRSVMISREDKISAPTFLGSHKFWEIIIPSPSKTELQVILDAKFAKLRGAAVRSLIHLWEQICQLCMASDSGRRVGVRELEKFCARLESLLSAGFYSTQIIDHQINVDDEAQIGETPVFPLSTIFTNPSLREDIFVEAQDVFFGVDALTASARAYTKAVIRTIGNLLELDVERQDWLINGRAPPFVEEKDVNGHVIAVLAGCTRLLAKSDGKQEMTEIAQCFNAQRRPFAMHKPAAVLLSRIARAVALSEPVLLTGETGTGKTSAVTYLAGVLQRNLVSLNLSHQSESSDLIGGFKPVNSQIPAAALMERWEQLFGGTFSRKKNEKFESEVRKAARDVRWARLVGLWKESGRLALDRIRGKDKDDEAREGGEVPRKRRKVEQARRGKISQDTWADFLQEVDKFEVQHVHAKGKFAFGFVEGPLVKALRSGDWILLDEINLASPEVLECITGLLHGPTASITLTEQGSLEPVRRHSEFRLFACMNPATDVGKKDLPPNIRAWFTEIHVLAPDADKETLLSIVTQYIGNISVGDKASIMNVAEFYQGVKALAEQRQIADGSNHRPHYSMRTLTRTLTFANDIALIYGFPLRRALWEGILMAFTMVLDKTSTQTVSMLAHKHVLSGVKNPKSLLAMEPNVPRGRSRDEFIKFGPFYLERGPYSEDLMEEYVITPSVESKLIDLARITLTRRYPVLIEGPTSSGKTSAVEYLAKRTGHLFVRINNHEHTDIQEYIGSYVSDPLTGKLVFKDGLLVQALRNGDWIVLDELNLAPTDVLEALNRLLDDNRELVIPETQEVVKPHPHFMLFATQNPPGLYAGRKVLSRAFRNRFLEVHFEDVPQDELESILCQRCHIAPSYGKKIVAVFHELQKRRQTSRVFESKHGFATLRDLFRWAGRDAIGYQELAENGYMLIGERARRDDDKAVVKDVIENIMRVKIDEKTLYDLRKPNVSDMEVYLGCPVPSSDAAGVVWTNAMQRLFILICRALRFNEPVLLVGETGSGKTSVCQVYANAIKQRLLPLNCHQNTETADLIGSLRPMRNRSTVEAEVVKEAEEVLREVGINGTELVLDALVIALKEALKLRNLDEKSKTRVLEARQKLFRLQSIFEWHDGPLIEAMRNGDVFLLDEISLADDSVLERLNSVLEPSRTVVLAEKGGEDSDQAAVKAQERFKLVATMNPGGDYGKKELSPALRNRFTEIWVPPIEHREDFELIVNNLWRFDALRIYTNPLLVFVEWLCSKVGDRTLSNLRDILAWVAFTNSAFQLASVDDNVAGEIFYHAAHMTFLDGLGSLPQLSSYSKDTVQKLKSEAESKLEELVPFPRSNRSLPISKQNTLDHIMIGPFAIRRGPRATVDQSFNLQAPTTQDNAMRIMRACQLSKPILLEGSPGVGKTSLVTALANFAGYHLYRINLSDQTDLVDLFGSDLPIEGGGPGEFAWRDAEFLRAMQEGHWVLLDEMNLAPQAVLEGLNAVLDHRGTVYIPELSRSFTCHPSFRVFAAQNPLSQGGGRKGLPKSFINRFTKVYIEELSSNDLFIICRQLFPQLDTTIIQNMIKFNMHLNEEVCIKRSFGQQGSPWEFNLRDVIRWAYLLVAPGPPRHPVDHLRTVYLHRFRTKQDRLFTRTLFDQVFGTNSERLENRPPWTILPEYLQFGYYASSRMNLAPASRAPRVLKIDLPVLESIGLCVSQSWLTILTGHRDSGKTEAVRLLAHFTGNVLQEVSINSANDTTDILGSFEQVDTQEKILTTVQDILALLDAELRNSGKANFQHLHECRQSLRHISEQYLKKQGMTSPYLLQSCLSVVQQMDETPSRQSFLSKLNDIASKSNAPGRFEWVDGPLVNAMRNGNWILLDNANLCNPSVLDRLNSLCEPDGFLTLSECGFVGEAVQIIKPHPNFRLFMTVDPQYGELSRAMRNRGIEIHFLESFAGDDPILLRDYLRYPESVDFENWKLQCFFSDHARRGLRTQLTKAQISISSSGRALDQESVLGYIIDEAPLVIKSSLIDKGMTNSLLHFFARTAVPRYALAHWRSFGAEDAHLHAFQDLLNILISVGKTIGVPRVVYSDFALCQSMDLFLATPLSIDKPTAEQDLVMHHMISRVLDFAVIFFLFDKSFKLWSKQRSELRTRPSVERAVLEAIDRLLQRIDDTSRTILGCLDLTDIRGQTGVLNVVSRILNYGCYLCNINCNLIDHSTLISLSQDISNTIDIQYPNLHALQEQAQHFNQTVSLSSGLGLFDIWASLYASEVVYLPKGAIARIDELASSLKKTLEGVGLRKQALEYLALATLKNAHGTDRGEINKLGQELEHLLSSHSEHDSTRFSRQIGSTFLVVELSLLSLPTVNKRLEMLAKEFVDITTATSSNSLLRVVPYKHLLWFLQSGEVPLSFTARMHIRWLYDACGLGEQAQEESEDTSTLSHPVLLANALSLGNWNQRPLTSLPDYERQLTYQAQLTILQYQTNINRSQQVLLLWFQSLCLLAQAFAPHLPPDISNMFSCEGSSQDILLSINDIFALMEKSSHQALAQAARHYLKPLIDNLINVANDREPSGTILGQCWAGLSFLLFNLFIPSAPIDPAAIRNSALDRLDKDSQDLSTQITLHCQLEKLKTGNLDNAFVLFLQDRLEGIASRLSQRLQYPIRQDLSRLHMYWAEISQFCTHVLIEAKILNLFDLFEKGKEGAMQAHVVQKSITGFYQRLDSVYADFADINLPLKLSMLYLKFGIRLAADMDQPVDATGREMSHQWARSLINYPGLVNASILAIANTPFATMPAIQHVTFQLTAFAFEIALGIDITTRIDQIDLSYQKALRLWLIDRTKEQKRDDEASSLYRPPAGTHHEISEAELEEQEFLSFFPSFEGVLNQEPHITSRNKPRQIQHVQPEDASLIADVHVSIAGVSAPLPVHVLNSVRRSFMERLIQAELKSLPPTLDDESLAFQLSLLNDRLQELDEGNESYNFYFDANILETRKALIAVQAFKVRVDTLLVEWPDQMVLHHLRNKCAAFLALGMDSSLAKLLAGLEQLLIQSDDWEMYANKENTLKIHRQTLTNIIIDWRRLELSCWRVLLDSQAKIYASETNRTWWFRLYETCVYGAFNAEEQEQSGKSEALSEYLDNLIPLLDDFISSSTLGQFQARLQLLQSFERYLSFMSVAKSNQKLVSGRVQCILYATTHYFDLYSSNLARILQDEKAGLEKEVQEFIRLASWKDTNVQALKASAQKTHHQIFKVIRKFREVLKQPIRDHLRPQFAGNPEVKQLDEPEIQGTMDINMPGPRVDIAETNAKAHLARLQRTFSRYIFLIVTRIRPFIHIESPHVADNLAIEIISIARELSSVVIPNGLLPEKREKQQKALVMRKRKVWSDLLKELKRAGFSPNPKASTLRHLAHERWLREQPILLNEWKALSTDKIEMYFSRLKAMMPQLRASLANHHPDISTRDLGRGLMSLESGFWVAIDLRHRLFKAIIKFNELNNTCRRLGKLSDHPKVVASGPEILHQVRRVIEVLCRLSNALHDVLEGMKIFNKLKPQGSLPEALFDNIESVMRETSIIRDKVADVLASVQSTRYIVVVADEYEIITTGFQHVNNTKKHLQRWAQEITQIRCLVEPVLQWIDSQDLSLPLLSLAAVHSMEQAAHNLIESLLVAVQSMLSRCPEHSTVDIEGNDHYIIQQCQLTCDFTDLFDFDTVINRLDDAVMELASSGNSLEESLQRVKPFLDVYLILAREQLSRHCQWTKALFKLDYVVCSIMLTLSEQGFCKPDDAAAADMDFSDSSGGVGLGGGTGMENVSKEIEDESQVEGSKGEKEDVEHGNTNADQDAIEMDDITGEMQDLPEEGAEDDRSRSDEASDEDLEERLGKLGASDPSVVDEKLWGDEKGPDGSNEDDKTNQDHGKEKVEDSEVVAKEKEGGRRGEKDKEQDTRELLKSHEGEQMEEDVAEGQQDPKASGAPLDDHIPEADTLNLPNDLNLEDQEMNSPEEESVEEVESDHEIQNELQDEDIEEHVEGLDGPGPNDDRVNVDEGQTSAETTKQDDQDAEEKSSERNEGVAQADITTGEGGAESSQAVQGGEGVPSSQEDFAGRDVSGFDSRDVSKTEKIEHSSTLEQLEGQQQIRPQSTGSAGFGSRAVGAQQSQPECKSEVETETNPVRNLGDALKEIRQRFDEILKSEKQEDPKQMECTGADVPSQVQYLHPEEEDHEMQALGPAGEEQVVRLNDLKLIDDDTDNNNVLPMDLDDAVQVPQKELSQPEYSFPSMVSDSTGLREGMEGAILHDSTPIQGRIATMPDLSKAKADTEESSNVVEMELRKWQSSGYSEKAGERIWRLYESLTHDLAYILCEQLRLILEPTLATRLRGDYRTGKRLNMKKVISYIASDYTKDKIWLRRTRPSQREYQVLIAIDDSRSMAESHSIHLAYQTLALVAKALSRLESGDIAIAKFGESVHMLHGFDEGQFTDRAGAGIINSFRFNQKATNVLSLVEMSLKVLESARERHSMSSATSGDLWQLEIIISDGLCQDHDRLRTLLRKAEEQRVMIVFIIIDSLHCGTAPGPSSLQSTASNSILNMDKAEYKIIDGRVELQLHKYLDSFPFEYYVILRDVEALPDVLAGTLKQFFERISES